MQQSSFLVLLALLTLCQYALVQGLLTPKAPLPFPITSTFTCPSSPNAAPYYLPAPVEVTYERLQPVSAFVTARTPLCNVVVQCTSGAPFLRVVTETRSMTPVFPGVNASATNIRVLAGADAFIDARGASLSSATMPVNVTVVGLSTALFYCYAAPCQSNASVNLLARDVQLTFLPTVVMLDGEVCRYEPPFPCDAFSFDAPVAGVTTATIPKIGRDDLPLFTPFGSYLPFRVLNGDGRNLWPTDGSVATGSADGSGWDSVIAFAFNSGPSVMWEILGPLDPSTSTFTAPLGITVTFQCWVAACPVNGSLVGSGDSTTVTLAGNHMINAECSGITTCNAYRQLRIQISPVGTCRYFNTSCAETLITKDDPEYYNNRVAPVCSSAQTVYPLLPGAPYSCDTTVTIQCIPMCNSVNHSDPSTGFYTLSNTTELFLMNDADGSGTGVVPTIDSACWYPVKCDDPAYYVLFNVTGMFNADKNGLDELDIYSGTYPNLDAIAGIRLQGLITALLIPITNTGMLRSVTAYFPKPPTIAGFTAKVSCISKPSFTCNPEPVLVWDGEPVVRSYVGLIPFLDTCTYDFTCPVNMFASVTIELGGGYAKPITVTLTNNANPIPGVVVTIVDPATGATMATLQNGPGTLFSNTHNLTYNWKVIGVHTPIQGNYSVTFDCWVSQCPFNATTARVVQGDELVFMPGQVYEDNVLVENRTDTTARLSLLNVRCQMQLFCSNTSHTVYAVYDGLLGANGNFSVVGARSAGYSGPDYWSPKELHLALTDTGQATSMSFGIFMLADSATVDFAGPTFSDTQSDFEVSLRCAPRPCSMLNFDPDSDRLRESYSNIGVPWTGSTGDVDRGSTNEADTFLYYMYENCTLNLITPASSNATYAVLEVDVHALVGDAFWMYCPDEVNQPTFAFPDARYYRLGQGNVHYSRYCPTTRAVLRIETDKVGRSLDAGSQTPLLSSGSLNVVYLRGMNTRCPNGDAVPTNISEGFYSNFMRPGGEPYPIAQPFEFHCEWFITCPNADQGMMVSYDEVQQGIANTSFGRFDMASSAKTGYSNARYGRFYLPPGSTLHITSSNTIIGIPQYWNAWWGPWGIYWDVQCTQATCSVLNLDTGIGSDVPYGRDVASTLYPGSNAAASINYAVAAGPVWPYYSYFWFQAFPPVSVIDENCQWSFKCPLATQAPLAALKGNVSGVSPGELSMVGTAADGVTTRTIFATSDFGFESHPVLYMGNVGETFILKFQPKKNYVGSFGMEFRCFEGACCSNVSQPVITTSDVSDEARRPIFSPYSDVCPATTPGQVCTWISQPCDPDTTPLTLFPATGNLRVLSPPLNASGVVSTPIYVSANVTVVLQYAYTDTTQPAFPDNNIVISACMLCNKTAPLTLPRSVLFAAGGVALPFPFSCTMEFTCPSADVPMYPVVSLLGFDASGAAPLIRNMMQSFSATEVVSFADGPDGTAPTTLAMGLPIASGVRGFVGSSKTLRVTINSVPLIDGLKHAVLFDLNFTCPRLPCLAQQHVNLVNGSRDVDALTGLPWLTGGRVTVTVDQQAYSGQTCQWAYRSSCASNDCSIHSWFALENPANVTDAMLTAVKKAIATSNPPVLLDFVDSGGADYLQLAATPYGVTSATSWKPRAENSFVRSIPQEARTYTVTIKTTPGAVLLTSNYFPVATWNFRQNTASRTETSTVKVPRTGTEVATATVTFPYTGTTSTSLSATNSSSWTLSTSTTKSSTLKTKSDEVSPSRSTTANTDVTVVMVPTSLSQSTIRDTPDGRFSNRVLILFPLGSAFADQPLLQPLDRALVAEQVSRWRNSTTTRQAGGFTTDVIVNLVSDYFVNASRNFANLSTDVQASIMTARHALRQKLIFAYRPPTSTRHITSAMFMKRASIIFSDSAIVHVQPEAIVLVHDIDKGYFSVRDETVSLSVDKSAFSATGRTYRPVNITVVNDISSFVPAAVVTAAKWTQFAGALGSVAGFAGFGLSRNDFLVQLAPCVFDPTQPGDPSQYPLQLGITDHLLQYQIGTMVYNPLTCLGILALHAFIVSIVGMLQRKPFWAAAAVVYFPAFSFIPYAMFYSATVTAALYVITNVDDPDAVQLDIGWRILAGFELVVFLVSAVGFSCAALRRFGAELAQESRDPDDEWLKPFAGAREWIDKPVRPYLDAQGTVADERVLSHPRLRLKAQESAYTDPRFEGYCRRNNVFFDPYRPKVVFFLVHETLINYVVSILTVAAPDNGDCRNIAFAAMWVFLGVLLMMLYYRPYRTMSDAIINTFSCIIYAAAAAMAWLAKSPATSMQYILLPTVQFLVVVNILVSAGQSFLNLGVTLWGLQAKAAEPLPTLFPDKWSTFNGVRSWRDIIGLRVRYDTEGRIKGGEAVLQSALLRPLHKTTSLETPLGSITPFDAGGELASPAHPPRGSLRFTSDAPKLLSYAASASGASTSHLRGSGNSDHGVVKIPGRLTQEALLMLSPGGGESPMHSSDDHASGEDDGQPRSQPASNPLSMRSKRAVNSTAVAIPPPPPSAGVEAPKPRQTFVEFSSSDDENALHRQLLLQRVQAAMDQGESTKPKKNKRKKKVSHAVMGDVTMKEYDLL